MADINNHYEAFEKWADDNGWFLARLYDWGAEGCQNAEWISPSGNIVTLKLENKQIKDLLNTIYNVRE